MLPTESLDYTVELPSFAGPLDLLLRLIERAELDITAIALAQVADQYLAHVRALPAPDPAGVSAFLVMAARLLVIKSRALLPQLAVPSDTEALEDAEALVRQLQEYQRYKQAAQLLRSWEADDRRLFLRSAAPPLPFATGPIESTIAEMIAAVQRRRQLMLPLETPGALPAAKGLTGGGGARVIHTKVHERPFIAFTDLLAPVVRRVELVVTLWAVLELIKRQALSAEQEELFGPIVLRRGLHFGQGTLHELRSAP
ncbi:MAG TPA: segregation/condensation protein A [Roseiflexaceae bacterium]|nr:segregation/condensation protein A [Roseiflexaceae bacterium]